MTHTPPSVIPGPSLLTALRGLRAQGFLGYVGQLWRTHGDTFQIRLGRNRLTFVIHPDAVGQVNVTHRQHYDKLASYDSARKYLIGDGLVTSTGALWKRQRKLMSPFFTPRGVEAYSDVVLQDGMQLANRWEGLAQRNQVVDIGEEMTLVTASIILKALFSTETDEDIIIMKDTVETMLEYTTAQRIGVRLPEWVPTPLNRRYVAARDRVNAYINGLIERRRAMPEDQWPNDLLSRLMQARDDETGQPMSDSLLRDESITMFFAGHETTARTMSAAWYALAANPAVAERLHDELDAVLGERAPTVADLHRLPYTMQVVKEVLRLYPAAPFYARDAVTDDTVGTYTISAGSTVMLSPYYTHRHPDFWERPLEFDPDRWTPEREEAQHPHAYHPFAGGQRICIGNHLSLLESHLLLALLAKRFTPKLLPGYTPEWTMQGTLSISNGLPMRMEARQQQIQSV